MLRALIIKLGAIGDVVMVIPAAWELSQAGYSVDWVCGGQVAPVLELYPWIRTIVGDERGLVQGGFRTKIRAVSGVWHVIAGQRYDVCATLYYDSRYKIFGWPVRAKRKMMLSTTGREGRLIPGRHHTDEYARILLGWKDGPRPTSLGPVRPERMPPSPLPRTERRRVILTPGGARNMLREDALRRWPVEDYVAVARELIGRGVEVVISGGSEDRWAMEAFEGMGVRDCVGRFTLVETLGLLDEADVLLTHDTGPLHLAGLTSIGIVSVFGPTDPYGRLPQRANSVALWGGEGFACRPCYDGRDYAPCADNACMRQVSVEMAVGMVLQMIKQRAGVGFGPQVIVPESTVRG